jgi:hypothetical protein
VGGWMHGWMDGWMDGWVGGGLGWMDGWMASHNPSSSQRAHSVRPLFHVSHRAGWNSEIRRVCAGLYAILRRKVQINL